MKKNSTKIMAATLALVLAMAMAACGGSNSSSSTPPAPSVTPSTPSTSTSSEPAPEAATPEELAKRYEDAIVAARDEEMNKYNPVTTNANKDTAIAGYIASAKEAGTEMTEEEASERYAQDREMLATVTGIKLEDAEAFAISASMMNIKAYGIAIVKPMEGKGADVEKAMKDYVAAQQKAFESYLVDQKEVADAAIVKTLEDGTVVMVMSENQDAIYDTIVAELGK